MVNTNNILRVFSETIALNIITLLLAFTVIALYFMFKKNKSFYDISEKKSWLFLTISIGAYIILFTGLAWYKYAWFNPGIFDLGNMTQAIWNTLHGELLRMTTFYPVTTRLYFHVEPIFLLLAPLYALWQNPKMLLLLQSIILALGAVPVFLIAREKFKLRRPALLIALSYLLLPALHQGNLFDFHPLVLAPTIILFGFYFALKSKDGLSFIFFLLALLCREEIAFMVFFFGLYLWLIMKKRWGIGLAAVGLLWGMAALQLIIPTFSPTDMPLQYMKYARLGDTPFEVIRTVITNPGSLCGIDYCLGKINYILFLLTPTALVSLFHPLGLVTGLFSFATIFLSDDPGLLYGKYQYSTPLMAPLIIATIYGIVWLTRRIRHYSRRQIIIYLSNTIILINVLLFFFNLNNSLSIFRNLKPPFFYQEKIATAKEALAMIPDTATVVASWRLGTHIANRRGLYLIDTPMRRQADYIIVSSLPDVICYTPPTDLKFCEAELNTYQDYLDEIKNNPDYRLLIDKNDILFFQKIK